MNPVLLKPQSEVGAQIVVQGRVYGSAKAAAYQQMKPRSAAVRARQFRAAARRGRSRAGRRRRQRRGGQSARKRHRQYGICARRGCAGRADRRYRPRRRDREPRRHQSRARRRRMRRWFAASSSTSFAAMPRCLPRAWSGSRKRPAGRRSAWSRIFADARLLPAEDALALRAKPAVETASARAHRRSDPAAHRQFRRSRSARRRAVGRSRARASGRGASRRRRSHRAARLEGDHRRPRRAARRRLRHRHCRAPAPRRNGARPLRRLSRCSGAASPIPTASKARPAAVEGLGLLDVATTLSAEKRLEPVRGTTGDGAPFARLRDAYGRDRRARLRAALRAARRRLAGRRGLGRRPRARHLCPRPVRRRSAARGVACALPAAPRPSPTTSWSSGRSTLSPRISPPISISTACSPWRDDKDRRSGKQREQNRVGAPVERERADECRRARRRGARRPSWHRRRARRHKRADQRAKDRALPPSPLRDTRHWASGGVPRRAARRAMRHWRTHLCSSAAAAMRRSAERRDAGRLTRSSSRAAAQPKAS